jgi:hypothetical protein
MVKVVITYAISQSALGNHSLHKHSLNTRSQGQINTILRRNTTSLMNISVLCSVQNYLATYPSPVCSLPQLEKIKVKKIRDNHMTSDLSGIWFIELQISAWRGGRQWEGLADTGNLRIQTKQTRNSLLAKNKCGNDRFQK